MHSFPKNLKTIRLSKKLTQDQLAEKLHVTRQTVSSWERGRSEPDLDTLGLLAEALEVRVEDLIYGLHDAPPLRPSRRSILWIMICFFFASLLLSIDLTLTPYLKRLRNQTYSFAEIYHLCYMGLPQLGYFASGSFLLSLLLLFRPVAFPLPWRRILWLSGLILALPAFCVTLEALLYLIFPTYSPFLTYRMILAVPRNFQSWYHLTLQLLPLLGGALFRLGLSKKEE
ncbi:MAG: helix-turn-helix transcriptional regulator [Clostridia bacterium]|nr:helix-turn-helix transcriptional regulator [Clostridia bacterium]